MTQLPLPLGHRPALGREDFLVAPANAEAVAWIDRWPDWPAPAVVLHGPPGCGKSHLAEVFAAVSGAVVLAGREAPAVDPPRLLAEAPAVVIDDADAGLDEAALFHLYNGAREAGRHLLLTARRAPGRWVALADLRSRLSACPAVAIGPPDDAVMAAVLIKLFADRQLKVGTEVITYLLRHMERSFAAAQGVVAEADGLSLAERRGVTVPLVRRVLDGRNRPP
jgi:DnaA regulatory inactivator Hda